MNRLTFDEYGCLLALCAKSRSEDPHTKVGGAAFDKDHRVLGVAYNGLTAGREVPAWMLLEENREEKGDYFLHAESNLCAQLTRGQCYTIFLTISPCKGCCQNIVALGIKRVVYLKEYHRCQKFKDILSFHCVDFMELPKESKNRIKEYLSNGNLEELE